MKRYDSYYLRAVHPVDPIGVWIRHTWHHDAGETIGGHWLTIFTPDGVHASRTSFPSRPAADPDHFVGEAGDARWDVRVRGAAPAFAHLPARWMYRTRLPKTKPVTIYPLATASGVVSSGSDSLKLDEWPAMVGHNWGSEHAHRWIWIHVAGFDGEPGSWLDLVLARLKIGRLVTPWLPNGAVCIGGRVRRVGGLFRRAEVREHADAAELSLSGAGLSLRLAINVPAPAAAVVWEYGDFDDDRRYVTNCSIAAVRLDLLDGEDRKTLSSAHRGVYELGADSPPANRPVRRIE